MYTIIELLGQLAFLTLLGFVVVAFTVMCLLKTQTKFKIFCYRDVLDHNTVLYWKTFDARGEFV